MPEEGGPGFDAADRDALGSRSWAICVATFYDDVARRLVDGALAGFADGGIDPEGVDVFEVPGAFELPLAAKLCAAAGREASEPNAFPWPERGDGAYAGVACLGAVVRGETDHYDHVCRETARGIQDVALETGVPCAFGVITADTFEQALERAGGGVRDQGRSAAHAVMRLELARSRLGDRRDG